MLRSTIDFFVTDVGETIQSSEIETESVHTEQAKSAVRYHLLLWHLSIRIRHITKTVSFLYKKAFDKTDLIFEYHKSDELT